MQIGQRLRELRESKRFSQGDIEKRTGLLCCYVSRVENGFTVHSVETLEKFARALEIPLYRLFYEGEEPPGRPNLLPAEKAEPMWGTSGKEWSELHWFAKTLGRMNCPNRKLLFGLAQLRASRRSPTWSWRMATDSWFRTNRQP